MRFYSATTLRRPGASGIGHSRNSISVKLMIFLIEYNRRQDRLVTFKVFAESERSKALDLRLL